MTPSSTEINRRSALITTLNIWVIELERSTSAAEDALEYLDGTRLIERYCLITQSNDVSPPVRYVYADFSGLNAALTSAFENVDDPIFAEHPLAVVDLDTGFTLLARSSPRSWFAPAASPPVVSGNHLDDSAMAASTNRQSQ